MAWTPVSNAIIQYSKNAGGASASGYYLKFYEAGTSTPFGMASASDGSGLLAKCEINSLGYPINGSDDVFIPYVNQDYRIVLYTNSTDADANTFASAVFDVDNVTQPDSGLRADIESSSGSGLVGFQLPDSGSVATNLEARGSRIIDLFDFMTTAQIADVESNTASVSVTSAFQAALDALSTRKGGLIYALRGKYLIDFSSITWPDVAIEIWGVPGALTGTKIGTTFLNDTNTGAMINISTLSTGFGVVFKNLIFDTNQLASHGFYLASVGSFQAIKNIQFNNVYVTNLKSGAIGWQIGDQTNTGLDTDAWNYNFYSCHARGYNGAIGWLIDATNAYNIGLYNCSAGRVSVGNEILTWVKTLRGSGIRVYNFFGDKLQSTGTPWGFDHSGGSLEIYGLSTEDRRVCKARSNGENDSALILSGVSVNDESGDGETCLDTTVRTNLTNCTFGSASYNRKITATNQLATDNVFIGSSGEYDLSGIALNVSVIEGHPIGSNLGNVGVNELCELWTTTTDPAAPQGWGVQKGTGTGTINQSTTNVEQGRYVVDINCTVASSGVFGIIENTYAEIDVTPWRGKTINFYAVFHRDATETPVMTVLLDGASTNVTGGTTVLETAATGGTVLVWGKVEVQPTSSKLTSMQLGLPAGQNGHVYLDSLGIIPFDFSSYTPALFTLVRNIGYDRFVSELRAGTLRLKDYTLWIDGTGDLRVLSGDRVTDTDGTIVGTQT